MWAAIFSRKPAAAPTTQLEVRAIEVHSEPQLETNPQTDPNIKIEATPTPEGNPAAAGQQSNGTNGVNTRPKPFERPTISSKRPRSSSGATEGGTSPLRKRPRPSLSYQATPKPQLISFIRSPLVRSRRTSDGPTTEPTMKESPLKAELKVEMLKDVQLQLTPTPVLTTILPIADTAPKRRPRPSLPAESERSFRESSVNSINTGHTEQDAEDFAELLRDGFSLHEAALFQRIRKRGLEPLMPAHWQVDFATMPDNLFLSGEDPAYIEALTLDGTFNATVAFQALVNLGAGVRGKLEAHHDVESKILLSLRKYIQWSIDDAKQDEKTIQPLIAISSSQGKAEQCEQRMDKKLNDLAREFRAEEARLLKEGCPRNPETSSTVYGLAVSGCIVALITLDARKENAPTRTLLVVDFSDVTLDFWNAVGIALLVISARDDELERLDFYEDNGVKKPVKVEGTHAWQGKTKVKKQEADSDEDA